jgi:hypothetical protein
MSGFLGGTAGQDGAIVFRSDDERIMPQWLDADDWRWQPTDAPWTLVGWGTPYWPRGSSLDASGGEWCEAIWCGQPEIVSGASSRYGFSGTTRDVYGTAILGATVCLFRSANGALVDTVISDATTGAFVITTPYWPDAHFIVASKSGVPDVAGTTVQTLIAA